MREELKMFMETNKKVIEDVTNSLIKDHTKTSDPIFITGIEVSKRLSGRLDYSCLPEETRPKWIAYWRKQALEKTIHTIMYSVIDKIKSMAQTHVGWSLYYYGLKAHLFIGGNIVLDAPRLFANHGPDFDPERDKCEYVGTIGWDGSLIR